MKAAIVTAAGQAPVYGEIDAPGAREGLALVAVSTAALSTFSKSRSTGAHYSAQGLFPAVAGAEGVGITADGGRVYFVLPEAPTGALAQSCLVSPDRCVAVPDGLDDVTAAAIANPGMAAWAALVERAALRSGETVLVNGATGSAGRMAVRLARHLGAGRIVATGRNALELETLKSLGADAVIPFRLENDDPAGARSYEAALASEFAAGVDIVIDYLWGLSAKTVIVAIAKNAEDGHAVRFVHVGGASGAESIDLPGAALRSSAIQLMGSGLKSVPFPRLLDAVTNVFQVAAATGMRIPTRVMPLSEIEQAWQAPGTPRVVISMK
ncbi:zinc-binding alcohol dehydrogenase family protein [Variovorax sp. dw_954]|uniref:quinone oxidoreductase family protein n=1 Tax=Variovorax sp. dw_954 TaxID=2720078 RepID=UPI001BD23621|nr:zinc-binding alcohol dehydrogenase family protein [Variovorax sp. dw_954]